MASNTSSRWFTLVQRELQEYRVSLLWTPLLAALAICVLVLASVLLANRVAAVGQAFIEVVTQEEKISGMNITIQIDDDKDDEVAYRIERTEGASSEDEWNFSRKWTFQPRNADTPQSDSEVVSGGMDYPFNAVLGVINVLMMVLLVIVVVNYLLGCLFDDRRDRSILFWKSMPVSEWEVVLAKLAVALIVAPAIFIGAALVAQLVCTALSMLLMWRMDMNPAEQILGNVHFGRLLVQQVGGWLISALWIAPVYAWLLLASAAARRSPFMTAALPVVAVVFAEELVFGSDFVRGAIAGHLPDPTSTASLPLPADLASLLAGLACTALLVAGAVWLRRHRWEI
ncbi:hypothetical protein [Parahaliea aestuarii]|uniref:ABC transporter permease n=1 Tax=Parahaliea aestuarii TaxID=1852021 RepID=A0A5C8ZSZ2_9GAMM|nr:hypothetical protein [Parahaliea aestuarii]TXS91576.1 hypothetical protein FVW59_10425 [Parahaliea aestuarii]